MSGPYYDEDNAVSISNRLACIEHELEERNKIEKAKLMEMQAARVLQLAALGFNVLKSGSVDKRTKSKILDEILPAQEAADKLTAEVLGETK